MTSPKKTKKTQFVTATCNLGNMPNREDPKKDYQTKPMLFSAPCRFLSTKVVSLDDLKLCRFF